MPKLTLSRRTLRWIATLPLFLGAVCSLPPAAAAAADAPELAQPGPAAVGLKRLRVPVPAMDGEAARELDALLWYPAERGFGAPAPLVRELKAHPWRTWSRGLSVRFGGKAREDAPLQAAAPLPVVLISHGLMGHADGFYPLAEHLASRGYAVLALQHDDDEHPDPLKAAIGLRPLDQAAAFARLRTLADEPAWKGRLATGRVALVGYSMGGYGALLSAGARLAPDGMVHGYTPMAQPHARPMDAAAQTLHANVAAVVAIAPWGAQSQFGGFMADGLARIRAPLLFIAGDQDDISGYADGTRSAWLAAVHAPRWLLTFENARHNIAPAMAPEPMPPTFLAWQAVEEPVWRRDRILDVDHHFITAFLDLQLRGNARAVDWLTVKVERSTEGQWPAAPFAAANADYAGPPAGALTHWQGFQRRWALGLRLEHRPAAKP